jgi:hypothetical protein
MAKPLRVLLPVVLVLGTLVGGAGIAEASSGGLGASARQVALGVSMKADRSIGAVDGFISLVGRAPALWSMWSDWGGPDSAFPETQFLNGLRDRGVVPLIIWQPANPADPQGDGYRYRRIIAGEFDAYIRQWAQAAKAWGGRVILRFAHEMNGYWFPWGISRFDNTPARFIKAWRHVWKIIRGPNSGGVGAKNVKFLWSPGSPCGQCTPYSKIYPGGKYVDYVGFTAFNWGGSRGWQSMVRKFKPAMRGLTKVSRKRVIVAETASSNNGGSKAEWIRDGYPAAYAKYPTIKAIVYFNRDMRFVQQPNWLLSEPAAARTEYRALLAQPRFQGTIP